VQRHSRRALTALLDAATNTQGSTTQLVFSCVLVRERLLKQ